MSNALVNADQRVLVICPHTDDEFGCAGTIHRLVEVGAEVWYLALSRCEESVPAGFPHDVLETECRRCMQLLGVPDENVMVESFPVRHFPAHRQELLELLVGLRQRLEPTLVLLPALADTHQDHATVAQEGFRAFKHASILGYELPQNLISFPNSAFVSLRRENLEAKLNALRAYRSQQFRKYAADDFIRSLATVRGVQCNAEFAEAFEAIRFIL